MPQEIDRMVGQAPAFLQVLEAVSQAAPLEKPVLIVGERGTGKELIASRLHSLSNRWQNELLKLNCAAISDTLIESELFGHEAGSFTGASRTHHGRFERADGGTLFLDELATTSTLVQEKLLRVIEYGEFERVGGKQSLRVDVRLIAATNEDLPTLAERGEFRLDLLDRLAFDVITLPPLRHRQEDIPLLAEYFAINMASELCRDYFPGFSEAVLGALNDYQWPGNLRELKNVIERAVYRTPADEVVTEIILDPFSSPYRPQSLEAPETDETAVPPVPSEPGTKTTLPADFKQSLRDFEAGMIREALQRAHHNQRKAAELLGLTYHQFRGYIKKHDLRNPSADQALQAD